MEPKNKKARPDIERLEGPDDVWVICFRKPEPGWRLVGRFGAPSVFVGFGLFDRHVLGRRQNYGAVAANAIGEWDKLFPGQQPFKGDTAEDYLGPVVWDVNETR